MQLTRICISNLLFSDDTGIWNLTSTPKEHLTEFHLLRKDWYLNSAGLKAILLSDISIVLHVSLIVVVKEKVRKGWERMLLNYTLSCSEVLLTPHCVVYCFTSSANYFRGCVRLSSFLTQNLLRLKLNLHCNTASKLIGMQSLSLAFMIQ